MFGKNIAIFCSAYPMKITINDTMRNLKIYGYCAIKFKSNII